MRYLPISTRIIFQMIFLCYIERMFTVVIDTENFLQLSFAVIAKILSSSSLHITSELEVLKAADDWLSHNFEERRIFACNLLLKVRLCLLSGNSLQCMLRESSAMSKDSECVKVIQSMLNGDIKCCQSNVATRYRYCNQDMFNILICGGCSKFGDHKVIHEIDGRSLKHIKNNRFHMKKHRYSFKSVYLKGEIYILYGNNNFNRPSTSVDKYSIINKSWQCVSDEGVQHQNFNACGLIDKIYICGVIKRLEVSKNVLLPSIDRVFDTNDNSWKPIATMKNRKFSSACSAYQGKVVVSGGYIARRQSNVVEAYDHTADEWTEMPSMINARAHHSQVAIRNKLFVVKIDSCEVFDSGCNHFVLINSPVRKQKIYSHFEAVSIGKKIVVYNDDVQNFFCYEVENNIWSDEDFELTKDRCFFSCLKVPQLSIL